MNGLNYFLQVNMYLILFAGFYALLLRNETFFKQNRVFLNFSVLLSFLIPFIGSEWFRDLFITQQVRETVPVILYGEVMIEGENSASGLTILEMLLWVYLGGVSILLTRFFNRLLALRSSLKPAKRSAFSFFNIMVVDPEIPESDAIISHEKVHMRQWHSADVLFMELVAIINWFNPIVYFYKKEIKHIHEFIADEVAAEQMLSKSDYAILLFSNTLGVSSGQLSNNFFNKSLLKRRIMMLNKNKSNKAGLWKYGFTAPLFVLMLVFSAAIASSKDNALSIDSEETLTFLEKPVTISELPALKLAALDENQDLTGGKSAKEVSQAINKSVRALEMKKGSSTVDTLIVQTQPGLQTEYQGGIQGFGAYLAANMKYPEEAKAKNVQGRVIISFIVQKDGSIDEVTVVRGIESSLDAEAVRVIKSSPKWKPQIVNGEPVKVAYTMPINFNLPPKTGN